MIRLFILLILASVGSLLYGQSLSPSLLGSAGTHASDASFGSLDWSVGETIVNTLNPALGTSPVLTQGFHQVFVSVAISTDDPKTNAFAPLVYPNPGREWVNVESPEPVRIRLLSSLGVELIPFGAGAANHTMALREIPSGSYLLEIARSGNKPSKFFKLQIIQ